MNVSRNKNIFKSLDISLYFFADSVLKYQLSMLHVTDINEKNGDHLQRELLWNFTEFPKL